MTGQLIFSINKILASALDAIEMIFGCSDYLQWWKRQKNCLSQGVREKNYCSANANNTCWNMIGHVGRSLWKILFEKYCTRLKKFGLVSPGITLPYPLPYPLLYALPYALFYLLLYTLPYYPAIWINMRCFFMHFRF